MTRAINLKRGQFIVVTGRVEKAEAAFQDNGFGFLMYGRQEEEFNGLPLEVLAISLPFVAVTDGHKRFAVDSRQYKLHRVDHSYVRAMAAAVGRGPLTARPKRRRKQKPEAGACPRCFHKMTEVLIMGPNRAWHRICKNCGHDDGPTGKPEEKK